METIVKKEDKTPVIANKERKRETVTFQVSPDEKRQITYKVVKECGISVSEFIRTKIFMEPKKADTQEIIQPSPLADEEREIYEEKLKEVTTENTALKDELTKIKVQKTDIIPGEEKTEIENVPVVNENIFSIELDKNFKLLIDSMKIFRDEMIKNDPDGKLYDFNKSIKLLLLRGLKRTYNFNGLASNFGISLDYVYGAAEQAEISGDDI